jgi:thioredoxin-like negative regulator of GroEL
MIRLIIASAALTVATSTVSAQSFTTDATSRLNREVIGAPAPLSADEHLTLARRAASQGDFDIARREYQAALSLERNAGRLGVDATMGLVQVLYAMKYTREAAYVLDELANSAAQRGDDNTEARSRADALWLKADEGFKEQARADAQRVRTLLKQGHLSESTQRYVADRLR